MCNTKRMVLFLLLILVPAVSQATPGLIRPGIILDSTRLGSKDLMADLKKEIHALLPGKVSFSDAFILSSGWRFQKAKENYAFLAQHPDVNLIIAFGVLSAGAVIENKQFSKPTMAVGIVEPDIQGLEVRPDKMYLHCRSLPYSF